MSSKPQAKKTKRCNPRPLNTPNDYVFRRLNFVDLSNESGSETELEVESHPIFKDSDEEDIDSNNCDTDYDSSEELDEYVERLRNREKLRNAAMKDFLEVVTTELQHYERRMNAIKSLTKRY